MHHSGVAMIKTADMLVDDLIKRKALFKGARSGLSTGFPSLDQYLSINKKYLMLITGMPSSGKSEVLDSIALNLAITDGWKWMFFTPETAPLEAHLQKLVEKKAGRHLFQMSDSEIVSEVDWIKDYFLWVDPPDDKFSLADIMGEVQCHIETGNELDAYVIDPWNELDLSDQGSKRDDQYISACLTNMRRFHRKYDLLTAVVIHPRGLEKDKTGNYPVPTLYDCNGGAMWRNKADYGLSVHRSDMTKHRASVYVQKVKYKSMGCVGMVDLDYQPSSGRFKDLLAPDFSLPEAPGAPPF